MGGDDENLRGPFADVPPTMPVACRDPGGISTLEIVDFLLQGQFERPHEHDSQLFCLAYVGFMSAGSARFNRDDHGLQLTVLIKWTKRLDFCARPFTLHDRSGIRSDDGGRSGVDGAKKLSQGDAQS